MTQKTSSNHMRFPGSQRFPAVPGTGPATFRGHRFPRFPPPIGGIPHRFPGSGGATEPPIWAEWFPNRQLPAVERRECCGTSVTVAHRIGCAVADEPTWDLDEAGVAVRR